MRRGTWHSATVAGALLGLVVVAPPSAAGPPYEEVFQGTEVYCSGSVADGRILEVGASFSTAGDLQSWWGGIYDEESGSGVWPSTATGMLVAGDFEVGMGFVDDAETPVGSLSVEGRTMPAGDPVEVDERWRDGNAQGRASGTFRELLVTADIVAADGQLADLVGVELTCGGAEVDVTQWGTNPATRIYRGSGAGAYCELGEDAILGVDVWGEEAYGLVALGIDWSQEEPTAELIAEGPLAYDGGMITGQLEVVEPPPAEEPAYVGVDLQVGSTVIDRGVNRGRSRNAAFTERYTRYELTGTITPPQGDPVAIEDCVFTTYSYKERYSSRAGQKPGGKPPANDLPADALTLAPGATDRTSTRGAQLLPEVPILLTEDEGTWEFPFGRTVWYSFEGTGGEVTVSTQGSNFDTVLAVYDAEMAELVWVDDSAETGLQASVAVGTEAGADYWVQVGGFDADWGTVVVSRS